MLKKSFAMILIAIIMINSSCLTIRIDKDREPLIDYGTPLVGHFRNKDTVKAVIYMFLFNRDFGYFTIFSWRKW